MEDFALRCPCCQQAFSGDDREPLADARLSYVEQSTGTRRRANTSRRGNERVDPAN